MYKIKCFNITELFQKICFSILPFSIMRINIGNYFLKKIKKMIILEELKTKRLNYSFFFHRIYCCAALWMLAA